MLNTIYANTTQFQDLLSAIQGGDTTAIATALGQIKTSIDGITSALGNLSTDVTQDATQWSDLITAIGSGSGGNVSIDSTQWTNLLTSVDKGDMTATATALGNIKSSIDNIYSRLNAVKHDSTQWSNLLTEIAKGDTTAIITALGNINGALGNIYTALGTLSINPTQWGNLITTLATQKLIMQDSTQWASLVNAISNQSLTVDLSNVTSSVVSNLSNVTGSTVTDAINSINTDMNMITDYNSGGLKIGHMRNLYVVNFFNCSIQNFLNNINSYAPATSARGLVWNYSQVKVNLVSIVKNNSLVLNPSTWTQVTTTGDNLHGSITYYKD